jgi:hypothetical protein
VDLTVEVVSARALEIGPTYCQEHHQYAHHRQRRQ